MDVGEEEKYTPPENDNDQLIDRGSTTIKRSFTYDEFLDKIGGFGCAQWFVFFVCSNNFTTAAMIVYGLDFLKKEPKYLCRLASGAW